MRIFLSYRRADVGGHAGRLTDALVQRLGREAVFHDVSAIRPGEDFNAAIDRALGQADAVLVVIGPGWLTATTADGAARLQQPGDVVRREVATALAGPVRVVPVLVGGARLPGTAELPPELRDLAARQVVVLRDESWHSDVDSLVRALRGERSGARRRLLVAGVAGAAVLLAASGAYAVWWPDGESSDGAEPAPCVPPDPSWATVAPQPGARTEVREEEGDVGYAVSAVRTRQAGDAWEVVLTTVMENDTAQERYHGSWNYDTLVVGRREHLVSCFSPTPDIVGPGAAGDALVGFAVRCQPVGYMQLVVDDGSRIDVTRADLGWGAC